MGNIAGSQRPPPSPAPIYNCDIFNRMIALSSNAGLSLIHEYPMYFESKENVEHVQGKLQGKHIVVSGICRPHAAE